MNASLVSGDIRTAFPQRVAARLTGSPWFWAIFVLTVFALPLVRSIVRELPASPPVLGTFPAFALVDQTGHAFSTTDVRGQILIAEFVPATSLAGGTRSPLADMQRRVRNTADAVHLVSFVKEKASAGRDDALEMLARQAGAGAWRWTLAGGETEALESATEAALRAPAASLDGRLLLVDARGRIRRITGASKDEIDLMMRDIGVLANLEGK